MSEQDVLQILSRLGAIITNSHIVYTSGKHGTAYVDKDRIYPHPKQTSMLCRLIADQFGVLGTMPDVVIGPAMGGIILSQGVAYHLSKFFSRGQILSYYAEKTDDGGFVIRRGGAAGVIPGKKVLVVEDVLTTTGGSARKVVEATRAMGGDVMGLGVICNRGNVTPQDVGDPPRLFALVNVKLDAWDEADCPLCAQGVVINTDVGKGREFLARKQAELQ